MSRSDPRFTCYKTACKDFCAEVAGLASRTKSYMRQADLSTWDVFARARGLQELFDKETCLRVDPLCTTNAPSVSNADRMGPRATRLRI